LYRKTGFIFVAVMTRTKAVTVLMHNAARGKSGILFGREQMGLGKRVVAFL
jgi:tRNA C32,U32 (ribose-2'-O)-methylase TrmJ